MSEQFKRTTQCLLSKNAIKYPPRKSGVRICVDKKLEVKFISDSRKVEDEDALHHHHVAGVDGCELARHPRVGLEVVHGDPGAAPTHNVLKY